MSNVRLRGGAACPLSTPLTLVFTLTHPPPPTPQLNRKSEMKYCDVCNTWIKNHPAAIAMHEQGANHKANVAKRESRGRGGKEDGGCGRDSVPGRI